MKRYRITYQPPVRFQQRIVRRVLLIRAFGLIRSQYIGMCGASTGYEDRCLVAEGRRVWSTEAVAGFIDGFMRAVRGTWPEWLPPQNPIFEVFDYKHES